MQVPIQCSKDPKHPSVHMSLYKGSWNADGLPRCHHPESMAAALPKPAKKWVLRTEDMPQLPSTICLVGGCAASAQTGSCPDNGENSGTSSVPLATRKILQKEYVKLLQILDATAIMPPHS